MAFRIARGWNRYGSQADALLPGTRPGAELRACGRAAAYRAAAADAPYSSARGGAWYAAVRADHEGARTYGRWPDLARGSAQYPGARAPRRGTDPAGWPGLLGASRCRHLQLGGSERHSAPARGVSYGAARREDRPA